MLSTLFLAGNKALATNADSHASNQTSESASSESSAAKESTTSSASSESSTAKESTTSSASSESSAAKESTTSSASSESSAAKESTTSSASSESSAAKESTTSSASSESSIAKESTTSSASSESSVAKESTTSSASSESSTAKESTTSSASSESSTAKESTTSSSTEKEEEVTGVVYAPVINNNPGWMIALLDGEGHYTGKYIPTNTSWKVFAKKTISNREMYRLGSDQQWVPAEYVTVKNLEVVSKTTTEPKKSDSKEEALSGVAYVPTLKDHPTWQVALLDGDGHYTGKYIPTNSNWKVFAKKTINNRLMYRLGSDQQWVPAEYATLKSTVAEKTSESVPTKVTSNEEALSGVAYVPTLKDHPTWQVALLDGEGHYTGKYISTNSNWRVFAKKTINNRLMYRLGSDQQWVPAEYATLKSTVAEKTSESVPAKATSNEEAMSGVAYAPVINNNPGWMIALLDGEGHYTGKYIPTNSNWKVLAKKTISGVEYYRLGNDQQWVAARYLKLK
ncbi:SLAP domain-containing protein [Lactobacillus mulieris]|nr:SLAP domain-containing protein [Lactobacillus mulieris]